MHMHASDLCEISQVEGGEEEHRGVQVSCWLLRKRDGQADALLGRCSMCVHRAPGARANSRETAAARSGSARATAKSVPYACLHT